MRCCFSDSRYSSVRMLWSRSASLTRTTRTSLTMARSILRTFSLARLRGQHVEAADFCDAFDEVGHVRAKALFDASDRIFRVFDGIVEQCGGQRRSVKAHVREDVRHFQQMREVGISGAAELVMMALGGNFVGAPHHPGIFRGPVDAELLEQFFEARVELARGAVAVKLERKIARGRHGLVYARRGISGEQLIESGRVPKWKELVYTRLFSERVWIPLKGKKLSNALCGMREKSERGIPQYLGLE